MQKYGIVMKDKMSAENGFTLIEVMVAILVLSIGILGVTMMLTGSISSNSKADVITTTTTLAADQIEYLMSLDYNDPLLNDPPGPTHGPAFLRNPLPPLPAQERVSSINVVKYPPDHQTNIQARGIVYSVYWNVADNYPVQKIKTVYIIVVANERGVRRLVMLSCVISRII